MTPKGSGGRDIFSGSLLRKQLNFCQKILIKNQNSDFSGTKQILVPTLVPKKEYRDKIDI
jgi:hypothetical protein